MLSSCVNAAELISPNKKIIVSVQLQKTDNKNDIGKVAFKISFNDGDEAQEILPLSPLGLKTETQNYADNLRFVSESKVTYIHDKYSMLLGKKRICENFANQKVLRFKNSKNKEIKIVFRAYNNGVAFRYELPDSSDTDREIIDELTTYNIPEGIKRWVQPFENSYENYFPLTTQTGASAHQEWGYPALFNVKSNIFMLVSEANLRKGDFGSRLTTSASDNYYSVSLPPARDKSYSTGPKYTSASSSPWRVLIIGNLADVVESTLITDVSDPSSLKDTQWIKPGAASWVYWANNRGSKDFQIVKAYVDLAAAMKWPYVLIDWEWDVMSNGGKLEDAVAYAHSKGIKPLIWYNSGTLWLDPTPNDHLLTSEKRAKEFAWLKKIGVYGIKVDFFAGDQADMVDYYINILEDAAKYELLVNFHGATVPRGWQRTYPNLMTVEGVYGSEWYNNVDTFTDKAASHNATLPFTRNVVGSMDYGPVTFSNSQHPHITSYGHELALSVVFESGLQHFADRPSAYYELPKEAKAFLKTVPVTWDETKLLAGYPGEYILIARRKGTRWFIAGINGTNEAKSFNLDLSFLPGKKHRVQLIKDGVNDHSFESTAVSVSNKKPLQVSALPRGGFVGVIN